MIGYDESDAGDIGFEGWPSQRETSKKRFELGVRAWDDDSRGGDPATRFD